MHVFFNPSRTVANMSHGAPQHNAACPKLRLNNQA
jgi:hypothetical protein